MREERRRTDLMFLPNLGARLRTAFTCADLPEERWIQLCERGIKGRCTMCEETVQGEDWARWLLGIGTDRADLPRGIR